MLRLLGIEQVDFTAVATVSGNIVTLTGKGSTTITATQAGNVSYNFATKAQVLTVK